MTACKDSLNGKKAVSATLAGVLAVGMVPAAAFAAEAPADEVQNDGIELLDTTSPVNLFNAGTIALGSTFSPVSGQTNQFTANATTDGTALDLGAVTVTPKGQSEVTATGDDFKVTITKDGTEVKEIKAPGTYTVSVEAVGGGKVSATITVKGASLENAELFQVNPDNAKDVSDKTFTYTGNVLDLGVQIGGKALKAGTDYTIKFVKAGGDANNDPAVEVKNADTMRSSPARATSLATSRRSPMLRSILSISPKPRFLSMMFTAQLPPSLLLRLLSRTAPTCLRTRLKSS